LHKSLGQFSDHLVAAAYIVEHISIDRLGVAIDLLVEHAALFAARPDAPRVVVDHIGDQQASAAIGIGRATELDLQIDKGYDLGGPSALDRFEKVNPRGPKLADLFAAAAAGDVRAIEAAIAFGVPVNARRADGANALLVAVEAGQRGAAKALLAQRGNPRLPDNQGRTALGIATARGDRAMIDLIQLWAPEP